MVKVREDLTGRQFGRLTVIEQAEDYIKPNGNHEAKWLCECSCPEHNRIEVVGYSLKMGFTQSCGCIHKEQLSQRNKEGRKYNIYDLTGEYGIGWTSNTNREFYFDLEDYNLIKDYCWLEHIDTKDGYCSLETTDPISRKTIRMHYLFGCKEYDHKDCNPLNNRRNNLRPATKSQNATNRSKQSNNTSGIVGVYWHKRDQTWEAGIGINNKYIHLGCFSNKIDAIKTRLKAEKEYFGEFAPQKRLYEKYGITE